MASDENNTSNNEVDTSLLEVEAVSYEEIWLTCGPSLGAITLPKWLMGDVILGGFHPSGDEENSFLNGLLEAYVPLPLLPEPPSLHVNPNPNAHQNNQSTVLNDKDDDFEIALHPLPIDESSRLLVKTESALTVEISLEHRESSKTTYSGEIHIPKGTFSIDLKLSELISGSYTLEVSSRSHTHEIEFSII